MKNIKKYISIALVIVIALSCLFVFTACEKKYDDRRLVESDIVYYIKPLQSSVKNFPLIFIDSQQSSLTLRADGTATFRLKLSDGIEALYDLYKDKLNLAGTDLNIILNMLYEYLPGLDFSDLNKTLEVFEGGLNIKLLGIDPNNANLQEMFAYIGETGLVPNELTIPEGFGLEINTTYYIKDIVSGHTGKKYSGIYMGNHHDDGEAFLMFDLTTDSETGEPLVIMNYELIDIYILASPLKASAK